MSAAIERGKPAPRLRAAGSWFLQLALILAIGLTLRAAGLGWGLPDGHRYYDYHPDETEIARAALQIDFGALQLSPRFFHYGSLPLYLDRLAVDAAARAGWIDLKPAYREEVPLLIGSVIRVARWITVLLGVLTLAVTAALGARLFGRPTGALAALLLALAPLAITQGHYATVDVAAGFWTMLCLLLCARSLAAPDLGRLALASAVAGLAASTKYNAGVVLLAPLYCVAVTWRRHEWKPSDRFAALVAAPLAALAALLLTTPGVFIDSATFWSDFRFELRHSATGHGLLFVHTPPAWLYHLFRTLPEGVGYPLALAVVAGVLWAVARRTPADGLLLVFVFSYGLIIGTSQLKFARYLLPILPALLLLAARLLAEGMGGNHHRDTETRRRRHCSLEGHPGGSLLPPARRQSLSLSVSPCLRGDSGLLSWAPAVVQVGVVAWTAVYGVAMAVVYTRVDPRDQAARWIEQERQPGDRVALGGEPWYYTPPLTASLGCTHDLVPACGQPQPDWLLAPNLGEEALAMDILAAARPRFVVVSEFEYGDPLRLSREIGYTDRMTALLAALPHDYRLVKVCRNRPSFGPLRWYKRRAPVHDLLYPMPDVRIYERAAP